MQGLRGYYTLKVSKVILKAIGVVDVVSVAQKIYDRTFAGHSYVAVIHVVIWGVTTHPGYTCEVFVTPPAK